MRIFIFWALLLFATDAFSASYYTRGTGVWASGSIWGPTTTGTGNQWSTITLVAGDYIYIDDDITLSGGDLTIPVDVTIVISAELTIVDKLKLTANSTIQFTSSGKITPAGPGNSEKIGFGDGFVWSGNDGSVQGPGTMDQNYNGTLPIVLSSFNLTNNNSTVSLTWTTTTEETFSNFVIERSSDGLSYHEIKSIAGAGKNLYDRETKYSFNDDFPIVGMNYYRLKAVDIDGAFEYFGPKAIKVEGSKRVQIYPNPNTGNLIMLHSNFTPEKSAKVEIYDNLGIKLFETEVSKINQTLELATTLKGGSYLLKYTSASYNKILRFVVK